MEKKLVKGEGPVPCPGMVVGEAPGEEEDIQGRPFVGKSGDLFEEALALAGVEREQVYITNVYKHRPPANRTPTKTEIGKHAMLLHKELQDVSPKCVLALGLIATDQFLDLDGGMGRNRGKLRKVGDFFVLPTYHPAFVLRQRNTKFDEFRSDVDLFVKVSGILTEKEVRTIEVCKCRKYVRNTECPKHGDEVQ